MGNKTLLYNYRKNLSLLREKTLKILYPPLCPVCQRMLPAGCTGFIHPECQGLFRPITEPSCIKCGKPLLTDAAEYCFDCNRKKKSFEAGRSLWIYDEKTAQSIFAYKYGGRREFADYYAQMLCRAYGGWIRSLEIDKVIPVPVSKVKKRQRGYNQAQILAQKLAALCNLEVDSKSLIRIHSTKPQKELGREERQKNLSTAFKVKEGRQISGRILLVDDIYTTGSTAEYCSRSLMKAGAEKVWILTLCIGAPF